MDAKRIFSYCFNLFSLFLLFITSPWIWVINFLNSLGMEVQEGSEFSCRPTPPVVECLLSCVSLYPANMWGCSCFSCIPTPCRVPSATSSGIIVVNYHQNCWMISDLPTANLTRVHPDLHTTIGGFFFHANFCVDPGSLIWKELCTDFRGHHKQGNSAIG